MGQPEPDGSRSDESGSDEAGSDVPVIEPVQSATVAAISPGTGWYWVGAVTVAAGLLIAFLMLIVGSFGYIRDVGGGSGQPPPSVQEEADATERLSSWGQGALIVAGAGVLGGSVIIVVTARGRRRSQAVRLAEATP